MTNHKVAFWGVAAFGLAAAGLTKAWVLLGGVLGYGLGFANALWLYRDTVSSMELDMLAALKKMRRSFFARLGSVLLTVALVGRFRSEWLLFLAIGIALGLIMSLVLSDQALT